jgi:hypothetical protein
MCISTAGEITSGAGGARVPALAPSSELADAGGLMSYGTSLPTRIAKKASMSMYRRVKAQISVRQPTCLVLVSI